MRDIVVSLCGYARLSLTIIVHRVRRVAHAPSCCLSCVVINLAASLTQFNYTARSDKELSVAANMECAILKVRLVYFAVGLFDVFLVFCGTDIPERLDRC